MTINRLFFYTGYGRSKKIDLKQYSIPNWQPMKETKPIQKMHLPGHSSTVALANTFSPFSINKISVSLFSLPFDSHSCVLNPRETRKLLQNITSVTGDEVRRLVLRAPCKSSD